MTPTLAQIIEAFSMEADKFESDAVEADPEELFIRAVLAELEAVQVNFIGLGDEFDAVALTVAIGRVPGLLHLYKIY